MKKLLFLLFPLMLLGCAQQPESLEDIGGEFVRNGQMLAIVKQDLKRIPDLCSLLTPEQAKQVKSLDLHNNKISSVELDLSCMTNLTEIDVSFNQVVRIADVGIGLKKLFLHQNKISSLESIADSTSLESLVMSNNLLTSLEGVDSFPNLINLEVHHNQLTTLEGVESLQKLEKIKLERNSLTSIEVLNKLPSLGFVTAGYNTIPDEQVDPWLEKSRQYIQNKNE